MVEQNVEQEIFLARVAEQAERFDDMVSFLENALTIKKSGLNADERNLLSVALKNQISCNRSALWTIQAIKEKPKYQQFSEALEAYRQKIVAQFAADCRRIINMIQNHILDDADLQEEAKTYFNKMVGDYYRYLSWHAEGEELEYAK